MDKKREGGERQLCEDTLAETNYEDDVRFEPGASKETMLLASDSFDDIQEIDTKLSTPGCRQRSGTISEIEDGDLPPVEANHQPHEGEADEDNVLSSKLQRLSVSDDSSSFQDAVEERGPDLASRTQECESFIDCPEWKAKKKHVFILSEAGKPIYSRYGSEDKLVTLMGVMQALVSCVQVNQDSVRCIVAGDHNFVFGVHGPIILVAVCYASESVAQLTVQLNYMYYQILSVLTRTQLCRIFEQRQNYDLRRLLSGSEKFMDNLLNLAEREPGFLLGAVRCLPLAQSVRDAITLSIVQHCGKVKNLVFAILIANNQLVALVRMKKYFLHPTDLHLVMNLVDASESFKAAESWTPICLPKFDSSGYLHGHVSYLTENCSGCLLLLTVDRDSFFTLSECKKKIVERLIRHDCIKAINEAVSENGYTTSEVGIPDLRHFLYKSRSTAQYTGPVIGPPYLLEELQEEFRSIYLRIHQRMHGAARPLKIYFCYGERETSIGWVTQGFELYAIFEPLVTKLGAVNAINKLIRWIKGVEDKLFILNSPTF